MLLKFLAILLFICLADMPYGYYELVRLIGLVGFAFLAYKAHDQGRQSEMILFIGLALFFQPFFKIALGRQHGISCWFKGWSWPIVYHS